jgi:glycosyltransferase involved in cell wall biosynthesis
MVTEGLARGGAERQMFALSAGLRERGHEVQVFELFGVAPGQAGFADEFTRLGIRSRRASDFAPRGGPSEAENDGWLDAIASILPPNHAALHAALIGAIRDFCPDVVNCWSDLANVLGGHAALAHGVRRVVLGQRSFPRFRLDSATGDLFRGAYRRLLARPQILAVSNSRAARDHYEDWLGLSPGTGRVVYNGFLPASVEIRSGEARLRCRDDLGIRSHVPVIGTVSRFAPPKDLDLWLAVGAALVAKCSEIKLVLAGYGHGTAAQDLANKGRSLGLADHLLVTGPVIDVGRIYSALDILLMSSSSESLPNVIIESQAAGIPVVAPDVGGIREAMLDGVTGIVVADRSAGALANGVLTILRDPQWKSRAASEGPRWVRQHFGFGRMIDDMITIYT